MLYGYIRVSTGTQALRGYSLEEQKQALINAGVEEKRIFMDAGKTGTKFQSLMDGLTSQKQSVRATRLYVIPWIEWDATSMKLF